MEPVTPIAVTVTFLRMDSRPPGPPPPLPDAVQLVRLSSCSVGFYLYLYNTVGADYCWWLRRTMPEWELTALLNDPGVSIHVLYEGGEPGGFFELDARHGSTINLSYFGLMPTAIGRGLGAILLSHAVDRAWSLGAKAVTVNTCTADHPRALPSYLRAGFKPVRQVREVWNIPRRLGMRIPASLMV